MKPISHDFQSTCLALSNEVLEVANEKMPIGVQQPFKKLHFQVNLHLNSLSKLVFEISAINQDDFI